MGCYSADVLPCYTRDSGYRGYMLRVFASFLVVSACTAWAGPLEERIAQCSARDFGMDHYMGGVARVHITLRSEVVSKP